MVLAAVLLPANLSAQEIMEPVDSVRADTVAVADNDVDEVIEVVDSIYIGEDDLIVDSILTDSGELVADTFKLSDLEKRKRSIPQYDFKNTSGWIYAIIRNTPSYPRAVRKESMT